VNSKRKKRDTTLRNFFSQQMINLIYDIGIDQGHGFLTGDFLWQLN